MASNSEFHINLDSQHSALSQIILLENMAGPEEKSSLTALRLLSQQIDETHRSIRRVEDKLNEFLSGQFTMTFNPHPSSARRRRSPSPASQQRTCSPSSPSRHRRSSASPPRRRVRTSDPSAEARVGLPPAPRYLLNRSLKTVVDVWREWSVGIGNGPAVKKLNDCYGSGWRAGWPQKERQYYSMRLVIINHIYHLGIVEAQGGEPRYEEIAERLERERGGQSLNALAKEIKSQG